MRSAPTTVDSFLPEDTNIDRALLARASHFWKLPGVSAVLQLLFDHGHDIQSIRDLNRNVVREELKKLLPIAERPTSVFIDEVVLGEV